MLLAGRLLTVSPRAKPSSISPPNLKLHSWAYGNPRATRQLARQNVVNFIAKPFRFSSACTIFIFNVMPVLELFLLT